MSKRLYLNAFDMNCIGHQSPGLWTHPDDQAERYKDLDYWVELAQTLERGGFDAIFIADVVGYYDVYENSRDAAVRQAAQIPANDPLLVIPAMAQVTEHLGFGVTYSTTYEHPYVLARRLSTLDHLTKGRIAWNIVTSYLDSGAKNTGMDQQHQHDDRYEIAAEYVDVCYKLWEQSWEDDAIIRDKENKVYTDPKKVHDINHQGKFYRVPGAHMCEPSPQRTPVLYQAGASTKGREFAAKHAECVFTLGPNPELVGNYVRDIRQKVKEYGRDPEDVLIFTLLTPIVATTEEEAQQKYTELQKHVSYEGALALIGGWTGIDFSQYHPDQILEHIESNAIQTAVDLFTKADPNRTWTVNEVANHVGIGGMGAVAVGTPEQIADELEYWVAEAGIDGFNLAYAVSPGTFEDFVELVIPVLERRGIFNKNYEQGTIREKLFGAGQPYLKDTHPARAFKKKEGMKVAPY